MYFSTTSQRGIILGFSLPADIIASARNPIQWNTKGEFSRNANLIIMTVYGHIRLKSIFKKNNMTKNIIKEISKSYQRYSKTRTAFITTNSEKNRNDNPMILFCSWVFNIVLRFDYNRVCLPLAIISMHFGRQIGSSAFSPFTPRSKTGL